MHNRSQCLQNIVYVAKESFLVLNFADTAAELKATLNGG